MSRITSPLSFLSLFMWVLSLIFLVSLAKGLSILLILSKDQFLVSLSSLLFFNLYFISTLIFIIPFFVLTLGFVLFLDLLSVHKPFNNPACAEPPLWFYNMIFFSQKFFLMFILDRHRKRQSMSRGRAEREGDTDSEAGSRLWPIGTERDAGLKPTNCKIMT